MQYWLLKSEPHTFSIDDLLTKPNQIDAWEGVRNYTARNFMRDKMQVKDLAFFYHSSCEIPGVVGIVEIVRAAYPDPTQFEKKSKYYDEKSTILNPRWITVDVKFKEKFKEILPLSRLKESIKLKDFVLLKKGNRLSVMPVKDMEWNAIMGLL